VEREALGKSVGEHLDGRCESGPLAPVPSSKWVLPFGLVAEDVTVGVSVGQGQFGLATARAEPGETAPRWSEPNRPGADFPTLGLDEQPLLRGKAGNVQL
jgi:hypothetical protein